MFKKGDKVRNKETGAIDTVRSVYGMPEYDRVEYSSPEKGFVLKNHSWEFMRDWELVEKRELCVGQTIRIPMRKCNGKPCEDIITDIEKNGMIATEKHVHYIDPSETGFEDIEIIKDVPQKSKKEAKPIFKEGDKVRVKDTKNVRRWTQGDEAVGQIITIDSADATRLNGDGGEGSYSLGDNKYRINYRVDDLELVKEDTHTYVGVKGNVRDALEEARVDSYRIITDESIYKPYWLCEKPKPKTTLKEVRHMLSILARKLLDSDVKALVEAGYLNSELEVTSKGSEAVYAMFFEQNKTELAKRARAELKKAKREEE